MIEGKDDLIFVDQDHKRRYEKNPNQFNMYTVQFSKDMKKIVGGYREDTGEKMTPLDLVELGLRLKKKVDWEEVERN